MANVSVNSLMTDPGNPYYYTASWKMMVEDYVKWLQGTSVVEGHEVADTERYRYEADFNGYLQDVRKISSPELQYITLRLNNMKHPREFGRNFPVIITVKQGFVDQMMSMMLAYKGID